MDPVASVVVPTLDRPNALARCLAALERQRGVDALDVVIVDAGSRSIGPVLDVVRSSEDVRLVQCTDAGPATARNAGVQEVRGAYVLFTDDDCEPVPEWAAKLLEPLRAGADVVAGVSVNGSPERALARASRTILDYVTDPANSTALRRFATANNLGCRRDVVAALPFDERYRFGGEDRDWCARVLGAGHTLVRAPDAIVAHHDEPTIRSFWRKHAAYGRGSYRFRRRNRDARGLEPPVFYGRLVRAGFVQGLGPGAAVVVAQVATAAGFAREALSEAFERDEEGEPPTRRRLRQSSSE